ncbi:hypothetical protein GCM10027517_02540 [Phycicoccus ginsengisoli]
MSPERRVPALLTSTATVILLGLALVRGLAPFSEPDVWWHLRVGEHVLDTHQLYGRDPWATFMDRPYLATQWLPEAVAAQAYRWAGLGGVLWLRAAAVVLLTVVVYAACRRLGGRLPAVFAASVAVLGASASLNPRPQLVSFVLFAVAVHAWLGTARDLRPRWWLIPLTWLWACSHGLWMFGILLGLVTSACLLASKAGRADLRGHLLRLGWLQIGTIAAVGVTPLGPRLLLAPLTVAGNAADVAEEWAATPVTNVFAVVAVGAIVLTAVLWLLRPARRPSWQYAWLALAAALVLAMWRLVPLGAILAAPLLTAALQEGMSGVRERITGREVRWLSGGLVATVAAAAVVAAGPQGTAAFVYPAGMGGVDRALDAVPRGSTVMVDFGVSGWLLWAHPELVPSADLRMESYGHDYLHRYIAAVGGAPGWQSFVDDVDARYALVTRASALGDALVHQGDWRMVASSPGFVLLTAPGGPR